MNKYIPVKPLLVFWILVLSSCTDLLNSQIGSAENVRLGLSPRMMQAEFRGKLDLNGQSYYCIEIEDLHPKLKKISLLLSNMENKDSSILSDQVACSSLTPLGVNLITQSTNRFFCSNKSSECNSTWLGYPSQIKLLEYISRNENYSYSVDYMQSSKLSVNNSQVILDIQSLEGPSVLGCLLRIGYLVTIPADILLTYPLSYIFDFSDDVNITLK